MEEEIYYYKCLNINIWFASKESKENEPGIQKVTAKEFFEHMGWSLSKN